MGTPLKPETKRELGKNLQDFRALLYMLDMFSFADVMKDLHYDLCHKSVEKLMFKRMGDHNLQEERMSSSLGHFVTMMNMLDLYNEELDVWLAREYINGALFREFTAR